MGIKCWVIGQGDVGHFRDESEYRAFAQGKPVLMLAEGRHNLAWNCWVPPSLWTPIRGNARVVGRELRAEIEPEAGLDALGAVRQPVLQVLGGASSAPFREATSALDARLANGPTGIFR